ncbi:MAG: J domain-containing protein [Acidimicrobiales bacterium]|nr:J domain-containing protein [Acidimicrobiales bacterium]
MTTELLHTDLYAVLGVVPDAGGDEITRAYRRLARAHHPDLHPDDPDAEERFKSISAAYDVLGDPSKREEYDRFTAQQQAGPEGFAAWGADDTHLADLLGHLFGGTGGGAGGWSGRGGFASRGMDLGGTVQITLRDAVRGTAVTVTTPEGRDVDVSLPAGIDHGDRIRVPGAGLSGGPDAPPGDLVLTIVVAPDPVFEREGADLHVEVDIDFPTLVLGGIATVPTLDGGSSRIRIPQGTRPGRVFRLRGKGVPGPRGHGDLLATVSVEVPTALTDDQRAAVEALRAATSSS